MADPQTEDYYRRRAEEYEVIYHREDPGRRKELSEESERLLSLVEGKTVLELASGTGWWTKIMSRSAQSIVAVDLSAEMLAVAERKKFDCYVTFVESNLMTFEGAPGMADVLALGFWFSHQPRQEYRPFFDQLDRLAGDNGKIWMIDNNPPAESGSLHDHSHIDEHGNNFKFRKLDDGTQFTILKNYFSESELEDIFSSRYKIARLTYGYFYWAVELQSRNMSS